MLGELETLGHCSAAVSVGCSVGVSPGKNDTKTGHSLDLHGKVNAFALAVGDLLSGAD